jgi:hypothetical protein
MMNKTYLLLLVLASFAYQTMAQSGKIQFIKTTHDYGDIKEEVGKAKATFKFTNVGKGDLKLVNVKTSCGCTASDYTKGVIKPGQTGYVKATYYTTNRPGPFRKTITVTTNDVDKPRVILTIKGNVIKKSSSEADKYPITIGNLKLINNHIAFNSVKSTEVKTDSVKIFNNWDKQMSIQFDQVPPHLKVVARKTNLKPQEATFIVVSYDAAKKADFGNLYDRIGITTNDVTQPMKVLNISANIIEDFSQYSAKQMKKAPKIVFQTTDHDFGTVKSGDVVTYRFNFSNQGKNNLIIRKTKASCGCTATEPADLIIKKKKSSYVEVKFNTRGYSGMQHKTVTIISNDPNNPMIVLNIRGTVSK